MLNLVALALVLFTTGAINGTPVIQQVDDFPEFVCEKTWFYWDCTFNDINITKENPRFQPYHIKPTDINEVEVGGTQMQVLSRDICDYFPYLGNLVIGRDVNLLEIADDAFENCTKLYILTVRRNNLIKLQAGLFKTNLNFNELVIDYNPLVTIDPTAVNQNPKFVAIGIRGTQIEDIPYETMFRDNATMAISVFSNNLKDFPIEMLLERTSDIRYVSFSDNDIPCGRVQEILNVLAENPDIIIYKESLNKPRESEVSQINGIICIS